VADDSQTRHAISQVYSHRGYILDPHGAVSFLGCQAHQEPGQTAVFLETAHPAKFQDAVQEAIGQSIDLPAYLRAIQDKEKQALRMPVDYKQFKNWLIRTT
jgi:threonine synthase